MFVGGAGKFESFFKFAEPCTCFGEALVDRKSVGKCRFLLEKPIVQAFVVIAHSESLVVALATQDKLYEKMVSNIVEVQARGARIIGMAKEGKTEIEKTSDEVIYIPQCADEVAPVLAVVPLQIFAYYVALERGCNIDKPKNLAKCVTVE